MVRSWAWAAVYPSPLMMVGAAKLKLYVLMLKGGFAQVSQVCSASWCAGLSYLFPQ